MKLYLAGPGAGKDKVIKGIHFVSGIAEVRPDQEGLIHYLSKYYQAFPEGSNELAEALEQFGGKEIYYGRSSVPQERPGDDVAPQSDGESASEEAAVEQHEDAATDSGAGGSVAEGSGSEDAGLDLKEVIEQACLLIPLDDRTCWTPGGGPKLVAVVNAARGNRDITRADVQKYGLSKKQVADRLGKG